MIVGGCFLAAIVPLTPRGQAHEVLAQSAANGRWHAPAKSVTVTFLGKDVKENAVLVLRKAVVMDSAISILSDAPTITLVSGDIRIPFTVQVDPNGTTSRLKLGGGDSPTLLFNDKDDPSLRAKWKQTIASNEQDLTIELKDATFAIVKFDPAAIEKGEATAEVTAADSAPEAAPNDAKPPQATTRPAPDPQLRPSAPSARTPPSPPPARHSPDVGVHAAGAVPEWIDMLADAHRAEWVLGKTATITPQRDGSAIVGGRCVFNADFADGRIRGRARKISGQSLSLCLRNSDAGCYNAFCYGGRSFGIGVALKNARWKVLGAAQSKPYTGMADIEFSVVGQDLVLTVEGEELIHVKDASLKRGGAILGTFGPNAHAQVADLRLQVLDGVADAPAAGREK
jgi:hypothetical protein